MSTSVDYTPPVSKVQRASVTVMVEAEGYDEYEAGSIAATVIKAALRKVAVDDSTLASTAKESCGTCGARAGVTKRGKVRSHISCETFRPGPGDTACKGSGKDPHVSNEPVITLTWPNGTRTDVRIKDAMETGIAAGNGYLWTRVTPKSFR